MRPGSRYHGAFLVFFALLSVPCFERKAFSVPDATGAGTLGPSGLSLKRLLPDQDECKRGLVIEMVTADNELKPGQSVFIKYKLINKSKTLTAEFHVRYGPHVACNISAFSATTGEPAPAIQTGMPKILGVGRTCMLPPGGTYEGTFRLDEKYNFSRPGLYRIVGNQHFAISDDWKPGSARPVDSVRPVMIYSNELFIKVAD